MIVGQKVAVATKENDDKRDDSRAVRLHPSSLPLIDCETKPKEFQHDNTGARCLLLRSELATRMPILGQKIGPVRAGAALGFAFAPGGDLGVMTGEEDVGNFPAAEFRRAGVLRRFEQSAAEAVVGG